MKYINLILVVIAHFTDIYADDCAKGWSVSPHKRCYQRTTLKQAGNRAAAASQCQTLGGILFTIETSSDYEDFKNIYNDVTVPETIYLGLQYVDSQWTWDDTTLLGNFRPWSESADITGAKKCVFTTVGQGADYAWDTNDCSTTMQNILCVSTSSSPVPVDQILKDIADIKKQMKTVASITTIFPPGFLYVQLPTQPLPKTLWPALNWMDVTKNYAGLFFRAEGAGSDLFNDTAIVVQQASNFNNFTISTKGLTTVSYAGISGVRNTQLVNGNMSGELVPGEALNSMTMLFDERDNRPKNTAIRIWKRQ